MTALLTVAQFLANPLKHRILRLDKTTQIVRIVFHGIRSAGVTAGREAEMRPLR
jgi:hypothetical protein